MDDDGKRTIMPRGIVLPIVVFLLAAASVLTLLVVLPLADRLTGGGVVALAPALPYVLVGGCLLGVVVSVLVPSPYHRQRAERHRARQAQRQLAARLGLSPRELEALLRRGCPVDERARLLLQARAPVTGTRAERAAPERSSADSNGTIVPAYDRTDSTCLHSADGNVMLWYCRTCWQQWRNREWTSCPHCHAQDVRSVRLVQFLAQQPVPVQPCPAPRQEVNNGRLGDCLDRARYAVEVRDDSQQLLAGQPRQVRRVDVCALSRGVRREVAGGRARPISPNDLARTIGLSTRQAAAVLGVSHAAVHPARAVSKTPQIDLTDCA